VKHSDKKFPQRVCDCCSKVFTLLTGTQKRCSPECIAIKGAEKKRATAAIWREKTREHRLAYNKEYAAKNPGTIKEKGRKYWQKIKGDTEYLKKRRLPKEYFSRYLRTRRAADPAFKVICNIRKRTYNVLDGRRKTQKSLAMLGCSAEQLRAHLESQFRDGMSWENYGIKGWHIDHIIPLASFKFFNEDGSENPDAFKIAMNYKNLQPLWAKENISKSDRILQPQHIPWPL